MKKLICLTLAFIAIIGFSACGNQAENESSQTAASSEPPESSAPDSSRISELEDKIERLSISLCSTA